MKFIIDTANTETPGPNLIEMALEPSWIFDWNFYELDSKFQCHLNPGSLTSMVFKLGKQTSAIDTRSIRTVTWNSDVPDGEDDDVLRRPAFVFLQTSSLV